MEKEDEPRFFSKLTGLFAFYPARVDTTENRAHRAGLGPKRRLLLCNDMSAIGGIATLWRGLRPSPAGLDQGAADPPACGLRNANRGRVFQMENG
jgi:hypothetical protein